MRFGFIYGRQVMKAGARSNDSPVCTGAESFIAGTASCRIEVEGIDELYQHIKPWAFCTPIHH